jgi:hypothetical protein
MASVKIEDSDIRTAFVNAADRSCRNRSPNSRTNGTVSRRQLGGADQRRDV